MPFVSGGSLGELNGTSEVTLVSSPSASTRRLIKLIQIDNVDVADVTIDVSLKDGVSYSRIKRVTLEPDDTLLIDSVIDLDSTSKSIVAVMAAPEDTSNPQFNCTYGDAT